MGVNFRRIKNQPTRKTGPSFLLLPIAVCAQLTERFTHPANPPPILGPGRAQAHWPACKSSLPHMHPNQVVSMAHGRLGRLCVSAVGQVPVSWIDSRWCGASTHKICDLEVKTTCAESLNSLF